MGTVLTPREKERAEDPRERTADQGLALHSCRVLVPKPVACSARMSNIRAQLCVVFKWPAQAVAGVTQTWLGSGLLRKSGTPHT